MYDEDLDPAYELHAVSDYRREAYGDPCPVHGTLRWQADCPDCEIEQFDELTAPFDTLEEQAGER